ncbi:MAG: Pr6Pr family membrane protein [Pseudomonadota bacterium]
MHRTLAATTGVVATLGILLQGYNVGEAMGTYAAAARRMSMFFTIWTNTTLAIVMLGAAIAPQGPFAWRRVQCVLLACITLVGLVFYTVLGGGHADTTSDAVAQFTLHAITPALALATFLTAPHTRLPWRAILWGLVPPAVYGPVLLARGLFADEWPYFFLNYNSLGLIPFIQWSIGLIAAFLVFTALFVALERALSR